MINGGLLLFTRHNFSVEIQAYENREVDLVAPKYKNNKQFKHLAFQIAAQLPEEQRDALRVLELARRLITVPIEESEPTIPLRLVDRD